METSVLLIMLAVDSYNETQENPPVSDIQLQERANLVSETWKNKGYFSSITKIPVADSP